MKAKALTLSALFTALMIAGAYIAVPTPLVPVTFQPFFSVLAGTILGPRLGGMSVAAYIAIGLAGVPVFAGFTGGIGKVLSPSFGFILGFFGAALLTGAILGRREATYKRVASASVAGILAIYLVGLPYMYAVFTLVSGKDVTFAAVALSMAPFFIKDLALSLAAAGLAVRLIPVARMAVRL
jgi:biotin transport system substrate-specific component